MARARLRPESDGVTYLQFRCPGCRSGGGMHGGERQGHIVPVDGPRAWGFNGSTERPTLTPSVLVRQRWGNETQDRVCHSFVTDGRIQYLSDCTHALAGQTVDLPTIEEG